MSKHIMKMGDYQLAKPVIVRAVIQFRSINGKEPADPDGKFRLAAECQVRWYTTAHTNHSPDLKTYIIGIDLNNGKLMLDDAPFRAINADELINEAKELVRTSLDKRVTVNLSHFS